MEVVKFPHINSGSSFHSGTSDLIGGTLLLVIVVEIGGSTNVNGNVDAGGNVNLGTSVKIFGNLTSTGILSKG